MFPLPFQVIYTLARLHDVDCVIAGGAAACYEKAYDIDVWVLGYDKEAARRLGEAIDPLLVREAAPVVEYGGTVGSLFGTYRVPWSEKPIQVLVTKHQNPTQLIEHFDLSIHAVAIDATGTVYHGKGWTPLDEPIRVLEYGRGYNGIVTMTKNRLKKLRKRYKLTYSARLGRYLQRAFARTHAESQ